MTMSVFYVSTYSIDENGRHTYIKGDNIIPFPGYALVPEDLEIPSSFPYVDIEVENGVVVKMTPLPVPPPPEPEPEPEPQPTLGDRVTTLESENDLLKQQVKAASDQNEFLEDCITEMAAIVYA